jgi:hypothetical protein
MILRINSGLGYIIKLMFDQYSYAAVVARYLPRDWPESVHPPGSEGWEAMAVTWLLDLVPEYRQYGMACRHPPPGADCVCPIGRVTGLAFYPGGSSR